jgi:hypothetical protein
MARQSQGLDVQARWAKLADAVFVAAHAELVIARNRSADREVERKIPVALQARFPNRQVRAAAGGGGPLTTKSPVKQAGSWGKFVKRPPAPVPRFHSIAAAISTPVPRLL